MAPTTAIFFPVKASATTTVGFVIVVLTKEAGSALVSVCVVEVITVLNCLYKITAPEPNPDVHPPSKLENASVVVRKEFGA